MKNKRFGKKILTLWVTKSEEKDINESIDNLTFEGSQRLHQTLKEIKDRGDL